MLPQCLVGENLYQGHLVPIKLHYLLIIIPIFSCGTALMTGLGASYFLLVLLTTGPLLLGMVLVHEIGHMIAAAQCGCKPEYILLWPMGGLAVISDSAKTPRERAYISLMGPMTHPPMLLFWMLLLLMASGTVTFSMATFGLDNGFSDWLAILCVQMMLMNCFAFAFNLFVPCYPLDCSQIAMNMGVLYGMEHTRIAWAMVGMSVPLVLGFGIWGLYEFFTTGRGVTICLVALFLGSQTYQLYQCIQEGILARHPLFQTPEPPTAAGQRQPPSAATAAVMPGVAVTPSQLPSDKYGANVDCAMLLCLAAICGVY